MVWVWVWLSFVLLCDVIFYHCFSAKIRCLSDVYAGVCVFVSPVCVYVVCVYVSSCGIGYDRFA